ncbi:MAG: NAD-dependent epimerase/dehydratase family protein [Myxococcaceae bacterium]|nr:NAD-dependent epimerase/dehydratase family protein [Myxococcaceae bacterium]
MKVRIFDEASALGAALCERLGAEGHEVCLDGDDAEVLVELRQPPGNDVAGAGAAIARFAHLLDRAAAKRTPVVFASSADVYGATDKLPFGVEQPVDRHRGTRGAGLRAQELLAQAWSHQRGVPVTALRLFEVYGPEVEGFVADAIHAARSGAPLKVPGGLAQRRDFVFLDDVVEAFLRAIERPPEPLGELPAYAVHNVGSGSPTPRSRIVELVEAKTARRIRCEEVPSAQELVHSWADVRELQQAYGFRPRTPLSEGIARTVESSGP